MREPEVQIGNSGLPWPRTLHPHRPKGESMTKLRSKTAIIARTMCFGSLYVLVLLGCTSAPQQPPAQPDTRAADEAAVRKTDADWAASAQSKQVDAWVAFYSDDAVVLPPNDNAATSKDSIRKAVGALLALPGLSVNWRAAKVEVARSGDIAYTQGSYELTMKDSKGKPMADHGKYVEVWKKQSDGSWKCAVDMWSSDLPAAPPPSR
jgi:ketosteroid isomerase-like protein